MSFSTEEPFGSITCSDSTKSIYGRVDVFIGLVSDQEFTHANHDQAGVKNMMKKSSMFWFDLPLILA